MPFWLVFCKNNRKTKIFGRGRFSGDNSVFNLTILFNNRIKKMRLISDITRIWPSQTNSINLYIFCLSYWVHHSNSNSNSFSVIPKTPD